MTQVTDRSPLAGEHGHTVQATGAWAVKPLQEHTMFKTNVGTLDRILRVALGIALIALTLTGTIGVWGWIGVVPLLTAALGTCPAYTVLGMNTCPMKRT